jgi:hypothetical protein
MILALARIINYNRKLRYKLMRNLLSKTSIVQATGRMLPRTVQATVQACAARVVNYARKMFIALVPEK